MYIAPTRGIKRRHTNDDGEEGDNPRHPCPRIVGAPLARRRQGRRGVRLVTVCSGIEAVVQAFEHLLVPHVHVAACEKNVHTRAVLEKNFNPESVFHDLVTLRPNQLGDYDMLVAGFPCQPWSRAGDQEGFDTGDGQLVVHILNIINRTMPKVVLLENVDGLSERHAEFFQALLDSLRSFRLVPYP